MYRYETYKKDGKRYTLQYQTEDKSKVLRIFSSYMLYRYINKSPLFYRVTREQTYRGYVIITFYGYDTNNEKTLMYKFFIAD